MLSTTVTSFTEVPVDIGRDEAQDLARRELTEQVYRDAEPALWERATTWVWEQFTELLADASNALGGAGWVFLLIVVVIAVLVLIAWRAGTIERRRRAASTVVFDDHTLSSREHRVRAESAAAEGDWSTAIVEQFRALVRGLEERGWLDERPGRTADEAARDAGRHLPGDAPDLLAAARAFDEVVYGERAGSRAGYDLVLAVEQRTRRAEPVR